MHQFFQSNGLTERFNQTLSRSLAKITSSETHDDWDLKLDTVLMGYRASRQASTKFSPYYMLFQKEMRLPIHNKICPESGSEVPESKDEVPESGGEVPETEDEVPESGGVSRGEMPESKGEILMSGGEVVMFRITEMAEPAIEPSISCSQVVNMPSRKHSHCSKEAERVV